MKRLLSILVAFLILLTSIFANATEVYTYKTENYIAEGIKKIHLKTLTDKGWQNINIIEADLSDKYVDAKVFVPQKGLGNLQNVKTMAEYYNTSALVNADFFAWNSQNSSKGSTLGAIITEGKLLTSFDNSGNMASVGITEDEEILIKTITSKIIVTAPNGEQTELKYLNKFDDLANPSIYTSDFYDVTPGSFDNILEMVISKGKVLEMRREQEGIKIPENGYVIRVLPEFSPFMEENFKVGDKIEIEFTISFDTKKIKELSGGGTLLVENGKKTKITHNITGKNPRTVAGSDKTGKILYLITIDGRIENSAGMTLEDTQDFLVEFGIYNAINLDGGGSTTLVTKENNKQTVSNMPSGGNSYRAVASALGVVSSAPKSGKFAGFTITTTDKNVFSGFTRTFSYENPYDEYKNPYTKAVPEIKWSIDKKYGYFKENVLYAQNSGENISVFAKSGTVTEEFKINILDAPEKISAKPSHFDVAEVLNPKFTLTGANKNAQTALIEERDYTISENSITKMGYKEVKANNLLTYLTFSKADLSFETLTLSGESYPNDVKTSVTSVDGVKGKGIKLSYNFKGYSEETKASYGVLTNPLKINENKQAGVWVFSPYPLNQWLRAEFKTENGETLRSEFKSAVDYSGWKYLTCEIPENADTLTKLYIVQNSSKEQNEGYVIFDELSLIESSGKVSFPSILNAPTFGENSKKSGNYTFLAIGNIPDYNNLLSKVILQKTKNFIEENNFSKVWSMARYDFQGIDETKVTAFSSFEKDNSLFLNIDNSAHYITHTQFGKIKNAMKTKKDNLFVFLYEDLSLMTSKEEETVLKNLISEYGAKNTYVFYPSSVSGEFKEKGVNYISIGNIEVSTTSGLKVSSAPLFAVKGEVAKDGVKIHFIDILK